MRLGLACLVLVGAAIAIATPDARWRGVPLWPGARHTRQERDRAVLRGLKFIYDFARQPKYFGAYGHDLIGAFETICDTSSDPEIRSLAWRMGHERAIEWRRINPAVPAHPGPDDVVTLVYGNHSAEWLQVPDPSMRAQLLQAAARFRAVDYLGFDPAVEPPPANLPKPCSKCGRQNARGATVCSRCGAKLEIYDRYDLYQDALIQTYWGDRTGITLGAHYADVLKWLPAMRPWPARTPGNDDHYYSGVYTITHLVYTYNGYSRFRVSRACFPQEFEYLKDNLRQAVADKDPETMGEYLDSLRAFGLNFDDALVRDGFDYLLSTQNPDGSWGDMNDPDAYGRYHPTWTAIDGLRDYRWKRVLPCPAPPVHGAGL